MQFNVNKFLLSIPIEERKILLFYFGLIDGVKHSFQKTAEVFNVTIPHIYKLLEKLKEEKENKTLNEIWFSWDGWGSQKWTAKIEFEIETREYTLKANNHTFIIPEKELLKFQKKGEN